MKPSTANSITQVVQSATCPHLLPCGKCERTGNFCSGMLTSNFGDYPSSPTPFTGFRFEDCQPSADPSDAPSSDIDLSITSTDMPTQEDMAAFWENQ